MIAFALLASLVAIAPTASQSSVESIDYGSPLAQKFAKTRAQLNEFYAAKGDVVTDRYKERIEAALFTEDQAMAGDFVGAQARMEDLFDKYPLGDESAWRGLGEPPNTNTGGNNPATHAVFRQLEEFTMAGLAGTPAEARPLVMTIIIPKCSTGQQPANKEMTASKPLYGVPSDNLLRNDYELTRRWLERFQLFIWGLTDGERTVELDFYRWDQCIEIGYDAPNLALSNKFWGRDMQQVPREVHDRSDFYTFLYPTPTDTVDGLIYLGGQGSFEGKMLMMGPDRNAPMSPRNKGQSAVEYRLSGSYITQHEFMHYFFLQLWKEFDLEPCGHCWFDRSRWPGDFGNGPGWEGEYYYHAIHKRIRNSPNKPAQALSKAANPRAPIAQPYPGPTNWQQCASEGGTCTVSGGPSLVRFGAGEQYTFDKTSGSIACNAGAFGVDPAVGKPKTCAYLPAPGAPCAVEGERCNFSGSAQVRFGTNGKYVTKTFTGGVACNAGAFGSDPWPYKAKSCSLVDGVPENPGGGGGEGGGSGAGWTPCAAEGQRCSFSGTAQVRYGADGRYVTRSATGGVDCNNATFGDPTPGVAKSCSYQSTDTPGSGGGGDPVPEGWTECATEGERCSFSGTAQVRYGADGRYVTRSATGGIDCNNATFGDPAPGIVKSCVYKADGDTGSGGGDDDPAPEGWTDCATEGERCSFSGSATVRYGPAYGTGQFVTKVATNGIDCTNAAFGGDPAPNVPKACSYQPSGGTDGGTDGGGGTGWTPCAVEGQRCNVDGTATVRYGENMLYVTKSVTGGIDCTNAAFGRDPAPNVPKSCSYRR